MTRVMTFAAAAMLVTFASTSFAQSKTMTRETKVVTATVEAIAPSTRTVSVKKPDGTYEDFYVPTAIKRFDRLKVGDTITARYYENIVLRVKPAGEQPVDADDTAVSPTTGKLGGTAAHQRTITATISAIDPNVPSITFTGPHGWGYSTRVEDRDALAKVKVGDRVDITWTEAALVSIEPAKTSPK